MNSLLFLMSRFIGSFNLTVAAAGCQQSIPRHRRHPLNEFRAKKNVGIVEHAVFQRHNNKLRLFKMLFEHDADILSVGQIQGSVHLVEDVDGRRFEQQHSQDQREGHQRS